MKVLVDTNIILDVLCNRKDFIEDSLQVFRCCEVGRLTGYISALSVPNILYIMRKELDESKIKEIIHTLTSIFSVVELRESDLLNALDLEFKDYEDALQGISAKRIGADFIVTRNTKDSTASPVPAVLPGELLKQM